MLLILAYYFGFLRSNPFLHCIFMGVHFLIVGLLEETQRKEEEVETLQVKSIPNRASVIVIQIFAFLICYLFV